MVCGEVVVALWTARRVLLLCVVVALVTGCQSTASEWCLSVPRIADDRVRGVVVTRDGGHLVVVGGRWHAMLQEPLPGYAIVVDVAQRTVVRKLPQQRDGVSAVGLLEAGKTVVAASYDGTLLFWSFDRPEALRRVELGANEGTGVNLAMVVSADEKQMAVAGYRGNKRPDASCVLVCDAGGRVLRKFEAGSSPIRSMAFRPNGRTVALCDVEEGAVRLLDTVSGEFRTIRPGDPTFRDGATALAFTRTGKLLVGGRRSADVRGGTGWLELWSVDPDRTEIRCNIDGAVKSIGTDGEHVLVVQSGADALQVWSMDLRDATPVRLISGNEPSAAVLAPDGHAVMYVTDNGMVGEEEIRHGSGGWK